MYIPRRYLEQDPQTIDQFLHANDFATLVSYDGEQPVATHLLLAAGRRDGGALRLTGHMARANPQWRTFQADAEVLAIFSGPHTYISPRWYNHVNVPTWNYLVVHVYGKPRLITDQDELHALLSQLVDRHEAGAYRLDSLPQDFLAQQMKAIVGFQIEVTRIEASFKLSQNRDEQSYDNVVTELNRRTDDNSRAVAAAMQRRRSRVFGNG